MRWQWISDSCSILLCALFHVAVVHLGKKKPTDSEIKFMELVRFFCEVKVHDHAHYFVDSLWDHCEVLQDWPSITNLLLDAKSPFVLGDEETRTVVEILVCAARRAAGATPPAGRARNKVRLGFRSDEENSKEF